MSVIDILPPLSPEARHGAWRLLLATRDRSAAIRKMLDTAEKRNELAAKTLAHPQEYPAVQDKWAGHFRSNSRLPGEGFIPFDMPWDDDE